MITIVKYLPDIVRLLISMLLREEVKLRRNIKEASSKVIELIVTTHTHIPGVNYTSQKRLIHFYDNSPRVNAFLSYDVPDVVAGMSTRGLSYPFRNQFDLLTKFHSAIH